MPKEENTTRVTFTPAEIEELISGAVRAEKGLSAHEQIRVDMQIGNDPKDNPNDYQGPPRQVVTGVVVTITHKDKS